MNKNVSLTPEEIDRYTWQMWTPDFGEAGQRALRGASVLISRCGGVGGAAAMYLAAAGIGRLVIAHGGELRRNDLNRQTLMTTADIGLPRHKAIARTLTALNPHVQIDTHDENMTDVLSEKLVSGVDLVIGCAPLFAERFAMNRAAVTHRKPYLDAAMNDFEMHLLLVRPGETACLQCLYPEPPPHWKREFPVFGAVAATVGTMAAVEAIRTLAGMGQSLSGRHLVGDLRTWSFKNLRTFMLATCPVCGSQKPGTPPCAG